MRDLRWQSREALNRGVFDLWQVAEGYTITEGFLVPASERERLYFPLSFPELPSELAKVPDGDEKAALAFVHKWGLLGWVKLAGLWENEPAPAEYPATVGDPLDWFWGHAGTVRLVLRLLKVSAEAEGTDAYGQVRCRKALEGVIVQRPKPSFHLPSLLSVPYLSPVEMRGVVQVAVGPLRQGWGYELSEGELKAPQEAILRLVAFVLTANLFMRDMVQQSMAPDPLHPGRLRRLLTSKALLPSIYSHLADAACGGRAYAQCQWCESFFHQTDPRQEYCPNPLGKGSESLCSLKARQRKFQEARRKRKQQDNVHSKGGDQ